MKTICSVVHDGKHFTNDRKNKRLVAEASSLGNKLYDQLYEDAADAGMVIVNSKTYNTATFHLITIVKRDGEIESWEFLPTEETKRKNPGLREYGVTIIND